MQRYFPIPYRFHYLALLLLGSMIFGTACQSRPSVTPKAPERIVLQLKWKHQFQFAGYYAAQQQGFYRDAGLDVQIRESPDTGDPANAVLQGNADFGIAASDLVLLRSQGQPVVVLAAIYQHSPLIFLALAQSDIDTIHDIAKKRVMIEPHAAELLAYLRYESISQAEMSILLHTFEPAALLNRQVDAISAYSTDEPFLLQQAGLDYRIFTPRAAGIDFYGDTLFTTETQISEHPARVKAFLEASLKGWQYALDQQAELVDLIYTQYSQRHSREHLTFEAEKTRQLILPDVVELGYMNPGRWRHIADTYAEMGMVAPNISLDGFIYDRNPQTDMTWFYFSLLGALGMIGIVSGIAARFYQLNTIIRREMVAREIVTANLLALEQKYQILVEHAPFPILISCLRDGRILYINPKAAQKLEITQEHAIGKLTHDYYADPEDRDSLLVTIERQGYLQNAEVLLKATTGATFWVNVSATLIAFADEPAIFLALVDVTKRKELEKRLETMAMTDDLTGLFNRRYFAAKGNAEFQRAHRYKTPLSMLMLDIDRFKLINDTYGHEAGDHVLKECATLMGQQLREIDILGRLGGEEFGVLLPNTDESHTLILAERLRHTIAQHPFVIHGKPICITASIGVAALHDDTTLLDVVLNHADAAMYQAKQQGRNRVVVYGAEEEPSS